METQVKSLYDSGINVVVAAGKFGDLYLHFLNKYGIMGVRLTSKFDLRRLCRTIGAQAQSRIVYFIILINYLIFKFSVHQVSIFWDNVMKFI